MGEEGLPIGYTGIGHGFIQLSHCSWRVRIGSSVGIIESEEIITKGFCSEVLAIELSAIM